MRRMVQEQIRITFKENIDLTRQKYSKNIADILEEKIYTEQYIKWRLEGKNDSSANTNFVFAVFPRFSGLPDFEYAETLRKHRPVLEYLQKVATLDLPGDLKSLEEEKFSDQVIYGDLILPFYGRHILAGQLLPSSLLVFNDKNGSELVYLFSPSQIAPSVALRQMKTQASYFMKKASSLASI